MPKIVFALLGIILLVAGIFWFTGSSSAGAMLADELDSTVLELEDMLDDLAVAIRHDDLSAEELLYTHRDIITTLDRIGVATERASGQRVTTEDLTRIQDGLGGLARILETYLGSLAELDKQVATIPLEEYPDDIDESQRERTVLMTAVTTITDLAEIATVDGSTGEVLEDTIFDESADNNDTENDAPSGETAGEAIQLELAPAN